MPKPVPVITKMTYHENSATGYSVHVETLRSGSLDITLTIGQYHSIRSQLAANGTALVPTGEVTTA